MVVPCGSSTWLVRQIQKSQANVNMGTTVELFATRWMKYLNICTRTLLISQLKVLSPCGIRIRLLNVIYYFRGFKYE